MIKPPFYDAPIEFAAFQEMAEFELGRAQDNHTDNSCGTEDMCWVDPLTGKFILRAEVDAANETVHGLRIGDVSNADGQALLPVAYTQKNSTSGSSANTGTQPAPTILIVEDDHALRQALVMHFKNAGFDVTAAGDYTEAEDILRAESFSRVLTDFNYDGRDYNNFIGGADLVELINKEFPGLAAVVMTAEPETFKREAERRGLRYESIQTKPLVTESIIDVMRNVTSYTAANENALEASSPARRVSGVPYPTDPA